MSAQPSVSTWKHLLIATAAFCGGIVSLQASSHVAVEVKHLFHDQALVLDSIQYENKAGEPFSITRLSYFISGVALKRADGSWLEVPGSLAWIDAGRGRTGMDLGALPDGDYTGIRLHIGLDPVNNSSDPASRAPDHALNPNVNGLHWSWQGGYIFVALEGRFGRKDKAAPGYAYHLARDPFLTSVVIEQKFAIKGPTQFALNFNVAKVFDGGSSISFSRDGASTHSKDGDPIAVMLKANLSDAFTLGNITSPVSAAKPAPRTALTTPPLQLSVGLNFPEPALPEDNPLSKERVALGRRLFNEPALSRDHSLSCASCHLSGAALSDPRQFSIGVDGRSGNRNGMPLFNLAWKREFFWDGRATSLRAQALVPIEDHREMDEKLDHVVQKLGSTEGYGAAFQAAFGDAEITTERIGLAIENFLLTLTSYDSKFDKAQRGEVELSADEKHGFELFMMEREPRLGTMGGDCFHCHGGPLFTDHQFRNNGLAISETDLGRFNVTKISIDKGAFATPSLRNVALTAPYMHDGRFSTLEEVLDHYSEGVQRTETLDPNLAKHPVGGLHLTAEDKKALIAFLRTLTDDRFVGQSGPAKK
ncbi:MAG: cytochrome C peroxidase [Verrucomicrobiaceae bacterium]|nr:cytochrome C peroxidase [Verrucomicrobiaceae bacterium]